MNIFIYALFRAGGDGYCFGPRYLTGMVPVLMVYIAMLLEKKKDDTKWVAAIAILVVISVLIQIIGVFYFPFITDAAIGTLPLWDVHHLQIVEAVTSASPYFHRVYLAMIPPLNSPLLIGW
jgi:cytochrome bd-type quinol oxidase subunit 2